MHNRAIKRVGDGRRYEMGRSDEVQVLDTKDGALLERL